MINPENSKEIIDEIKTLTPEIYSDVAKPALQEIGSVAGRTTKALLAPLRGMLWSWEKIEELIEEQVNKKINKIPEEKRKSPEPEIAIPLLQALSYTANNETLREMYINLLSNSMDLDKINIVHPSFVEIIKQMNSLDAKVFEMLSISTEYQKVLNPKISLKGQNKFIAEATPKWYLGWTIENYSEFDISASLIRLSKFGLIELMFNQTTGDANYTDLIEMPFLQKLLIETQNEHAELELEIRADKSVLYVNEYGMQFKRACKPD